MRGCGPWVTRWVIVAVVVAPGLTGCSPAARDKLLRALVDGVPEKSQPAAAAGEQRSETAKTGEPSLPPVPKVVFHEPFAQQSCDSCHDTQSSQKLVAEGKALCFACHEDFTTDQTTVHAPVDAGLCTECHDPHQSPRAALLKHATPELCFTCHEDFRKDKKVIHVPVAEGFCLACHDPHASPNARVLKEAIPALCVSCHVGIPGRADHEGLTTCLDCHDPHGSNEEKLLK